MRVLVVGLGGLGCPAALALARAGVRRFTFADPDRVEPSNLHRQPWHRTSDVGRWKVESAAGRLRAAFPGAEVRPLAEAVTAANADALFAGHDRVIDGTDGVDTKLALSDAAVRTGATLVHGGVLRLTGQALVIRPGGPCLRCLFEGPAPAEAAPTCAAAGVLGSVAGAVGALQALLALAPPREGGAETLFVVEGGSLTQRRVRVAKLDECPACGQVGREAAACAR